MLNIIVMSLFQVVLVSRTLTGELVHQLSGETVVVTPPFVISRSPSFLGILVSFLYPCLVGGWLVVGWWLVGGWLVVG